MSFRNDDDFDAESYVKVNVRLGEFWAKYPNGRVNTQVSTFDNRMTVTASLYRHQEDASPASTGHAFLLDFNGEKVGEYTETVAVGRALALMGFKIEKSIASSEEMVRWKEGQEKKAEVPKERESKFRTSKPVSAPLSAATQQSASAAENKPVEKSEDVEKSAAPQEIPKKLTTSRIFKPLPKPEQKQVGGQ